ncbi:MAG: preprotein translocase subunit YajC [Bifidobacterium sp.]|nr:preprotein translocase subunit YajC [Bifidobacterium sp.]MCH4208540.1 preprotein translocase subunit YajC [Bifidobacterium sp.]MCI1224226.1 preprotein translocase subunit YajC [Bifidobacterium sp.]
MNLLITVLIIVVFGVLMWRQTKKTKAQQAAVQDFRSNLEPGTEVITIGGVIGKVVSVDAKYEEIVIDSEGSLMRFKSSAINKTYTRPAFIDDDEVDENGNPLPQEDGADDQVAYGEITDAGAGDGANDVTASEEDSIPAEYAQGAEPSSNESAPTVK